MRETRAVPCGTCTLCCRGGEAIILHPEDGDKPEDFETHVIWHPLYKDRPVHILAQRENGDCHYVGPFGCTIWDKRPMICREFDCRRFAEIVSGKRRRKLLAEGVVNTEVLARGEQLVRQGK